MFAELMLLIKFFLLLYGAYIVYQIKINSHVFNKNNININSSISNKESSRDLTRDRYSKRKVPKDIDVIVVGSGIGGLSCAAYLSKVGKKVLVLEQHYIAGGCCHVFDEKGVEHETGIHYVGNIEKRKEILDLISANPIEWCKMGEKTDGVYDEICIEGETYLFRAGEENFIRDLSKRFLGEEEAIRKYIELVKKVAKKDLFFNLKIIKSKWLSLLGHYYLKYYDTDYYKYTNTSAYDVIKTFTNNETLIAVLTGQFGDYGPTPKKANFFIHASIVNHYLEGGYFPKGGPASITRNIIPTIEASGGRVFVNAKVDTFLVDNSDNSDNANSMIENRDKINNKIVGVQLVNGDKIYAKKVVSAVGLNTTFNSLIPDELLENDSVIKFKKIVDKIGSSTGFIYCFVNLEGTAEELGLRDSNIWVYPDKDYDELLANFEADIQYNPMPMFIASSSAKDSSWNERYPNKSSMILLTLAKKEWFEQWENETCMKRNLYYKDLKEHMAHRLINEGLYTFYPKTKGKISHYEVGTPLTNQFYLGCLDGEGYGLDTTNYRYSVAHELRPETPIKNLYLTGQDICTLGFTGALMGGILTAHSILGYGSFMDLISGRNLIKDLIKLEKKKS